MLILNLLIFSISPAHLILCYMTYIYKNFHCPWLCILSPVSFPGQFCLLDFFSLIIGYISPLLCIPGDMWLDARHHDIVIFALLTLVQNQCTVCFFCQYICILKPCFVMNIKLLRNKILSVLGFKLHQLGLEQHEPWLTSLHFWVLSLMPYEW